MNHIGLRIKELRKKKDLTQEKLAEYLNVSFQAVSKWETGASSPDLSMIVPLARLLGVSTDALFGLADTAEDPRQGELRAQYEETWKTGDTAKRYEIAQAAVAEYPGNFDYLKWLADAEGAYAIHNCERGTAEQRTHFENAVRYFERIIEDCDDEDLRNSAIHGIVLDLPSIGRRDEALRYAKQHPDCDELLKCCLTGEDWERHRQEMIFRKLDDLVDELESGKHDLAAIRAAEKIIKTVIDDENYLWFHDVLMHNYIWQAMCLTRQNRFEEAVAVLRKSHEQAVLYVEMFDKAKETPVSYTSSVLNKISFDANRMIKSGTSTRTEDFGEYLSWKEFDALRDRADFQELLLL